jgi:signal transduction histidine kinase
MENLDRLIDGTSTQRSTLESARRVDRAHVHDHAVQFYNDEAFLASVVAEFLATGLREQQPAIVIATPAHRRAFAKRLRHAGVDVRALRQSRRFTVLDARQLLSRFMIGDAPDAARFHATVGRVIDACHHDGTHRSIRAYGEMVDLLWKDGNTEGAIKLEELWNDLAHRYDFSLLCAYSMGNFYRASDSEHFDRICAQHTRVVPTEPDASANDVFRFKELSVLQQRSRALETEIVQRELLEQRLRETVIALQEREEQLNDGLNRERAWRIRAEEARQEADRARTLADQANRAKSDFLAVMSHELRTPLNAIGGYAELMELGIHGAVTEQQRDTLDRIQRSQRVLLALINQVLNYARIESGTVRYEMTDIPLDELLRTTEALVSPQLRQKGLRYRYTGCPRDLCVRADGDKLRQIVVNLLTNAAKFTERGGEVRVEVRIDGRTTALAGGDEIHVRIEDTGIGIVPEKLSTIFEPFVQVDSKYTRTSDGVGLGLAISRDLARGMGGDVTVVSTVGEGAAFTLHLRASAVA